MAHSFGKVLLSTQLACGFATAIDGRVDKIVDNLGVVKPTFMGAAPRIFEKAHGRIVTMQPARAGSRRRSSSRPSPSARRSTRSSATASRSRCRCRLQHGLFDKLVFSKVRDRFGGRVRFFISGSAALNPEIAEWFHAAGILILEGYGMTENAAGATVNHPDDYKMGTVGRALPGSEVKIGEGDEVLLRGPHVMAGYHNNARGDRETLTDDGWLRTGDKGSLDADGFLTITGRIKDLFKTSGGKYIAPLGDRGQVQGGLPLRQPVHGLRQRPQLRGRAGHPRPRRDGRLGQGERHGGRVVRRDRRPPTRSQALVGDYVDQLNARLNRWETIKKWEILPQDLTIESGELTPSMKVKRNVVEDNNSERIAAFYG